MPISLFLEFFAIGGISWSPFPLLICSILLAMVLYAYKKRSFIFALKVFAISSVASALIFLVGLFGGGLILTGFFMPLFPLLVLLIIVAIGLVALKDRPLINFTLRAFAISFAALFLILGVWLMLGAYEHEHSKAIHIEKFNIPKGEYAEITEEELEEYPALKKAISGEECIKFNEDSWYCSVHPDEWKRTIDFFERKQSEYLFSMGRELEEDLNKDIITRDLKNAFESKGFLLSENSTIIKYSVFLWPVDKWVIYDEGRRKSYYIWKEDEKLYVYDYDGKARYSCFKVGENYYEVGFLTA